MTHVAHIVEKDLRRLRWSLVGWFAIVAGQTLIATVGADVALAGFGPQLGIAEMSQLLSIVYVVVLGLLISTLVHADPLVGREAFWITRPIAPGSLMAGKLGFTALFFVVVPLVGVVFGAAFFGLPRGPIARTVPVFLLNQLVIVMLLMAVATLTPSLARYAIAVISAISAVVVFTASSIVVVLFRATDVAQDGEVPIPDPTPAVVGGLLTVLVALAVIVHQYRRRRRTHALILAGVGALAVLVITAWWPRSFARMLTPQPDAAPGARDLTVALDAARPRVTDAFDISRRTAARKDISAHAVIARVPPEFIVRTVVSRSQLELPNGVVLRNEGGRGNALLIGNIAGSISGWAASVEAALGASLLAGNDAAERARSEQWPLVLEIDEDDFARHRSEPGRLTAEIAVLLERAIVNGRLPLAERATVAVGDARVSIAGVIRRATGCTVLLRRAFVESLFTRPRYTQTTYVLRNAQRGEAVAGDLRPLYQEGFSAGQWLVQPPHVGGRGLVVEQYELLFPANRALDASIVDLDASWVAGAELVMLESISAGRISRTVTVDGFRMAP